MLLYSIVMINTVVMCGIPTNETADELTGPHTSGETTRAQSLTIANTSYKVCFNDLIKVQTNYDEHNDFRCSNK